MSAHSPQYYRLRREKKATKIKNIVCSSTIYESSCSCGFFVRSRPFTFSLFQKKLKSICVIFFLALIAWIYSIIRENQICEEIIGIQKKNVNSCVNMSSSVYIVCLILVLKTKSLDNFQITLTHNSLLAGDVFSFIKYFNLLYRISRILYIT